MSSYSWSPVRRPIYWEAFEGSYLGYKSSAPDGYSIHKDGECLGVYLGRDGPNALLGIAETLDDAKRMAECHAQEAAR
jgi:hypothetical protein